MESTHISLPPKMKASLYKLARTEGVPLAELIRRALSLFLKENK
jgi:hypothetical protein